VKKIRLLKNIAAAAVSGSLVFARRRDATAERTKLLHRISNEGSCPDVQAFAGRGHGSLYVSKRRAGAVHRLKHICNEMG